MVDHHINLLPNSAPVSKPTYKMSLAKMDELCQQLNDLLSQGFICPSSSPYRSPVLFVKKKEGDLCLCIDYSISQLSNQVEFEPDSIRLDFFEYESYPIRFDYYLTQLDLTIIWLDSIWLDFYLNQLDLIRLLFSKNGIVLKSIDPIRIKNTNKKQCTRSK